MKIQQSRTNDETVHIKASASGDEVNAALEYAYSVFMRNTGIKVESGSTIDEVAKEQLGLENLPQHVLPYVMDRLIPLAIDKSGVAPAFIPGGKTYQPLIPNKPFDFECDVTLKPSFELTSYDPLTISVVQPLIFEDDIEREMEEYRPVVEQFDVEDKEERLRALVIAKLEDQNRNIFETQKLQMIAIEAAKRLDGDIPSEILHQMFLKHNEGQKAQLAQQGISYEKFLEEHGGAENVEMLMMWQARETLRQGYALDAVFRHAKLKITDDDLRAAACAMTRTDDATASLELARSIGQMHVVTETAQRFKATDYLLENAEINVREQTALE